ncbi:MAG: DUF1565 domain-containing protein, partial [Patescibacteria group bacterium]|nr:DUF1565 domain-containing protein [Patescibacteria group bacterium]
MHRRTVLLGVLSVLLLSLPAALAREYHVSAAGDDGVSAAGDDGVSAAGDDGANGTAERPLRTISAAAKLAQPGDVVTVHEGVYREWVNPPRGGESDAKRIVYQAAAGQRVVIKGSEVVTGWRKVERGVWKVTLPESFFGGYNPYRDLIRGDWFNDRGRPHHTGAVYLDGDALWE